MGNSDDYGRSFLAAWPLWNDFDEETGEYYNESDFARCDRIVSEVANELQHIPNAEYHRQCEEDQRVYEHVTSLYYAYLQRREPAASEVPKEERYAAFLQALAKKYECTHPILLMRRVRAITPKTPLPWHLLGPPAGKEDRYLASLEAGLREKRFREYQNNELRRKIRDKTDAATAVSQSFWREYRRQKGMYVPSHESDARTRRALHPSDREELMRSLSHWTHPSRLRRPRNKNGK